MNENADKAPVYEVKTFFGEGSTHIDHYRLLPVIKCDRDDVMAPVEKPIYEYVSVSLCSIFHLHGFSY